MRRPIGLLLSVFLLASCSNDPIGTTYGSWVKVDTAAWYANIPLPDGRTIPCLIWTGGSTSARGGMSCDWGER